MNLTDPTIGTVVVPLLVIAIVAGVKSLFPKLNGSATQTVAFVAGGVLYTVSFAIAEAMIPEPAVSYIVLAISVLAATLGGMGFYDLMVKPLSRLLSQPRS